jgi:HK97 family phage portal protein
MFEKLKSKFKIIKNSFSGSFTRWLGIANWEDGQTFNLNNIYNANAYVNIAINKIATNIVRAKLTIVNDSDIVVESGPAVSLFKNVNAMMSTTQLIEATVSWVLMRGETIWVLSGRTPGTITGVPIEITVVDPQFMHHTLNKEGTEIVLWEFQKDSVKIPFSPNEIIHFQQWNPITPWRGVNPLIAMEPELRSDMLINQSNNSLMKNRGVPAGLLTTEESITQEQAQEIRDMWDKAHGGSSKSGKTAVLGEGTSYTQLALTSADMEYFKSKQWNRSVILGRYGVPAIVAGYTDESTPLSGSDTSEQMEFFWNQTLIPMLKFFESKLETEFSKRFAPNLHIRFDTSEIAELQGDLELLSKRMREDVKAGIITQNEAREQIGMDKVSWGDTWWKNLVFVDVTDPLIPSAAVKNNVPIIEQLNNSLTIFDKPKPEERWPELFIKQHIWKVKRDNGYLSQNLYTVLKTWLYDQRSIVLTQLHRNGEINPLFWEQQKDLLVNKLSLLMNSVRGIVLHNIQDIMNIKNRDREFITDGVCGDEYTISRLSNYVQSFVIESIKSRDINATRDKYKIATERLHEVADREIEIIVNDMRTKIFTALNLDKSLWIQLDKPVDESGLQIFKKVIVNKTIPSADIAIIEKNEAIIESAVKEFYDDLSPQVEATINKSKSSEALIKYFVGLKLGGKFVIHMIPSLKKVWTNGAKHVYGGRLYDLSIKRAANFIKRRGLLLKESPDFVMNSMVNFIKSKGDITIADLTADILNKWDGITESRAALIAKTETAGALSEGAEEAMIELGIEFKRWVNMGDDLVRDEHLDSATGVFAKVGETFDNGLQGPGGYNCRCWLEKATKKESEVVPKKEKEGS